MTVSSSVTVPGRFMFSLKVTVTAASTGLNCEESEGMVVSTVGAGSVLNSKE